MKSSLTVLFEDPFWVGIFERIDDGKLSVCKVTFGAEPKDYGRTGLQPRCGSGSKANSRQSQTAAQERPKANGALRDRYEIPAGAPAATGGNEDGTPADQPGAEGRRSTAPV